MNRDNIAHFIKDQRAKVGMTQQDLAEILCTSRENISKWERGLAIPNTEYLRPLCKALQVPITDLLAGKTASNEEDASKVIFDIIDTNQRLRKRFFKIMMITILVAIFSFLTYYFLDNYNSIKLYAFDFDTDGCELDNSLLLVLKDKGYFILNDLIIPEDEELQSINIYYYNKNKEKVIIHDSKKKYDIIKLEFDISKINELLKNTYMDITTNKKTTTIKIDIKKRYANDELFDDIENNNDPALNHEFYFESYNFPSLEKFTYNEKEKVYKYQDKTNYIEYDLYTKAIFLYLNNKKELISFIGNNNSIVSITTEYGNECYYNYNKNNIVSGDCTKYLGKIEKLVLKYLEFIT